MPSALSESCMKFRLETLAPSGGWLASVAIVLSLKSGIYEYTILAIIFMVSFIILRTASCETAMVLALAYDLVIPFQYQNVQRHTAELEKYWPKFLLGTAIEAGCYLLCHPDLFNLAVIIKTSVLLIVWMKGKKEYPLNLAKDNQPPPAEKRTSRTRDPEQSSSSSSDVTPEYINYVMKELAKCTGENAVSKERAEEHKANLGKKASSPSRRNTEQSLNNRKIMLFKDWQAAQGGGGQGGGSNQGQTPQTGAGAGGSAAGTQPPAVTQPPTGNQPQAANHTQTQTPSAPPAAKYQYTKPTDAEIEQLKLDLAAKQSSFAAQPEKVTVPLLAGPDHPEFPFTINYLRHKGISTRKWIPMAPANKTRYRVPERLQDEAMDIIEPLNPKATRPWIKTLRASYNTFDDLKKAMADLNTMSHNYISINFPEDKSDQCKFDRVAPDGNMWYDYAQKKDTAQEEGPAAVARVENLYDFMCDPSTRPDPAHPEPNMDKWYVENKTTWANMSEYKTVDENDYIIGKAGLSAAEMKENRKQLNALELYSQEIISAILVDIKNSSSAQEARDIFKMVLEKSQTSKGQNEILEKFKEKTKSYKDWLKSVKDAEEEAAEKAAEEAEAAASG